MSRAAARLRDARAADLLAGFPGALARGRARGRSRPRRDLPRRRPRRADCATSPISSRAGRVTLTGSPRRFAGLRCGVRGVVRRASRSPADRRVAGRGAGAAGQPPPRRGERSARHPRRRGGRQGRRRRRDRSTASSFGRLERGRSRIARPHQARPGLLPTMREPHLRAVAARPRASTSRARRARRGAPPARRCGCSAKMRPDKPRRLLLLVDVSGSMKAHSEATLRFAHLSDPRPPKVETFCFGTRLSRVTSTLKHRAAGRGAGPALRPGLRLRRRHADRRLAGRIPVGVAPCRAGARRGHAGLFGRAGARRSRRR